MTDLGTAGTVIPTAVTGKVVFFFSSLPFLSLSVQFPNTIPIGNIITRFREVLQLKPQPAVGIELRTLIVEAHDTR